MDVVDDISLRQLIPRKRMQKQLAGFAALAVGLAAAEVYNSTVTRSLRYLKRCAPSNRGWGLDRLRLRSKAWWLVYAHRSN